MRACKRAPDARASTQAGGPCMRISQLASLVMCVHGAGASSLIAVDHIGVALPIGRAWCRRQAVLPSPAGPSHPAIALPSTAVAAAAAATLAAARAVARLAAGASGRGAGCGRAHTTTGPAGGGRGGGDPRAPYWPAGRHQSFGCSARRWIAACFCRRRLRFCAAAAARGGSRGAGERIAASAAAGVCAWAARGAGRVARCGRARCSVCHPCRF